MFTDIVGYTALIVRDEDPARRAPRELTDAASVERELAATRSENSAPELAQVRNRVIGVYEFVLPVAG